MSEEIKAAQPNQRRRVTFKIHYRVAENGIEAESSWYESMTGANEELEPKPFLHMSVAAKIYVSQQIYDVYFALLCCRVRVTIYESNLGAFIEYTNV